MGNFFQDIAKQTGRSLEDVVDEIARTPKSFEKLGRAAGLLGKRGFAELDPSNL